MTLTKDVRLGGGDGSGRGPRLRFRARVNNLLNRSQPRAYGNVLSSPLFGLPTGYHRRAHHQVVDERGFLSSEACQIPYGFGRPSAMRGSAFGSTEGIASYSYRR